MADKPTANWDRVGDRFYRRIKLYEQIFDEDLELENYTIAGAPYSGAVGENNGLSIVLHRAHFL